MDKTVSVVIPTHGRPDLLKRAIQSVLNQIELPDEIVVVDDLNDHATKEVCLSFKSHLIVYVANLEGKGAASSRNLGVRSSVADYICFLDDDDEFKANKIKKIKSVVNKSSGVDVIYHPAHIIMVNENVSYFSNPKRFKEIDDIFSQLLVKNEIGGTPMVTVKRKSFIFAGMFDESLPALEDYELWIRMAKSGCSFLFLDDPLTNCYYSTGNDSVSKEIESNICSIRMIRGTYKKFYGELSEGMLRDNLVWEKKLVVHKSLLNNKRLTAFCGQLSVFRFEPALRNFIFLFFIPFGAGFVFKLRARLGK